MADIFTTDKRSEIMSRIGGKNTSPELVVRSVLHKLGYRFRLHRSDLPGKPDIILPKYKTVIFVHGCYWHRHKNCNRGKSVPTTNVDFWEQKFSSNVQRDKNNSRLLKKMGWQVVTIWECEIKDRDRLKGKLSRTL